MFRNNLVRIWQLHSTNIFSSSNGRCFILHENLPSRSLQRCYRKVEVLIEISSRSSPSILLTHRQNVFFFCCILSQHFFFAGETRKTNGMHCRSKRFDRSSSYNWKEKHVVSLLLFQNNRRMLEKVRRKTHSKRLDSPELLAIFV